MKLDGATVLVTGGSRGLGRALALALAEERARIVLVARGQPGLASVCSEIRELGGEPIAIVADLADPTAALRVAEEAQALAGHIDVVIHNASTLGPVPLRLVVDTSTDDFRSAFEVNVLSPFVLTRALAGPMVLRGRGLVVAISSDAATTPYEKWGAYGASKAALDQLMATLGRELCESGVRFFSVDPGEMDTVMHRDAVPGADPATLRSPGQVARAIVSLMEDEARAPTGARVPVEIPGGSP
ncbi:MAG: SDR family oxidoreductase [Deltaproteobacteria bacterium]|nr:SDR family oxidoreductase [Deltaproteobacteria bacterium]